jgi:hypothetical protein
MAITQVLSFALFVLRPPVEISACLKSYIGLTRETVKDACKMLVDLDNEGSISIVPGLDASLTYSRH